MRRAVVLAGIAVAALASVVLVAGLVVPRPTRYTVVRGDTLFEIARDHGVEVDELRRWNGIEGDLLEVGQRLWIWPDRPPEVDRSPPPAATRRPTAAPKAPPGPLDGLSLPPARPCLPPPTGEGLADEGSVASGGLSEAQIRGAMAAFVPETLRCASGGAAAEGTLHLQLRVGCDGRVDEVEVVDAGGLPAPMAECIGEVLGFAPFPAHALPEGELFDYPITFRR